MPQPEGFDRTKVVVRKLPPYLKEDDFLTELKKHSISTYEWCAYYPGKASSKKVTYSRVYLSFKDGQDVVNFKSRFDGFVFVGARGAQYKCSVEYAPYQRTPKTSTKKDPREGTIHKDPDFKTFLEDLEKGPVMLPSAQKQFEEELSQKIANGEDGDGIITTPLMEFIVNKHLVKAANAKQREAKHRESRNARRSKAKSLPPVKVKIKPSQKGQISERSEGKRTGSGRGRRTSRGRSGYEESGHQILKKSNSTSLEKAEDPSEASKTGSSSTRDNDMNRSRRGNGDRGGRGSSRRGGRSEGRNNVLNRPNVKVVWIPKSDKTRPE